MLCFLSSLRTAWGEENVELKTRVTVLKWLCVWEALGELPGFCCGLVWKGSRVVSRTSVNLWHLCSSASNHLRGWTRPQAAPHRAATGSLRVGLTSECPRLEVSSDLHPFWATGCETSHHLSDTVGELKHSPHLISSEPPKDSCLVHSLSLSGAQFPHSLGWVLPHTLGSWLVKPGEDTGRWMRPWWRWKDRPGWRVGSREVGWGMAFSEWGGWEGNKTLLHNPPLSFLFFFLTPSNFLHCVWELKWKKLRPIETGFQKGKYTPICFRCCWAFQ